MACLIKLTDGENNYWETPKAGRVQVTGAGMSWLELVPDNAKHIITAKYYPEGTHDSERRNYPVTSDKKYQPSVWYVDVIENTEYDDDGMLVYIDKYLDIIFFPEGEISVSDMDELEEAYDTGDINKEQYEAALKEGELIQKKYCSDIMKTEAWCTRIRRFVEEKIQNGEPEFISREKKALSSDGCSARPGR
jgi:predicted RNA-binding protein associated with RNAse of E/G family